MWRSPARRLADRPSHFLFCRMPCACRWCLRLGVSSLALLYVLTLVFVCPAALGPRMYLQFNVVLTLALVSSRCCVSLAVVLPRLLSGAVRVVFHTLLGGYTCVDRLRRTGFCLALALLLSVLSLSWWRVACGSWRIAIASSA